MWDLERKNIKEIGIHGKVFTVGKDGIVKIAYQYWNDKHRMENISKYVFNLYTNESQDPSDKASTYFLVGTVFDPDYILLEPTTEFGSGGVY